MSERSKRADYLGTMFPYFIFGYAAAAMSFYRFLYKHAPVMVEEETYECKVYHLFETEEIRKAA